MIVFFSFSPPHCMPDVSFSTSVRLHLCWRTGTAYWVGRLVAFIIQSSRLHLQIRQVGAVFFPWHEPRLLPSSYFLIDKGNVVKWPWTLHSAERGWQIELNRFPVVVLIAMDFTKCWNFLLRFYVFVV